MAPILGPGLGKFKRTTCVYDPDTLTTSTRKRLGVTATPSTQ